MEAEAEAASGEQLTVDTVSVDGVSQFSYYTTASPKVRIHTDFCSEQNKNMPPKDTTFIQDTSLSRSQSETNIVTDSGNQVI